MVRYTGRTFTEVRFMPDFAPGPDDASSARDRVHPARQRTITLPAAHRRLMRHHLANV